MQEPIPGSFAAWSRNGGDAGRLAHVASYITPEGFQKLQEEVDFLWKVERPRVTHEVSEAAALGDRSENAEYIYGKKRLREIDRRYRYLIKRMDELTVVEPRREQEGKVFFGAFVTVADPEHGEREYHLVGPDESDINAGRLSMEAPLGKAMLGKVVGDEVRFSPPRGEPQELEVVGIRYEWSEGE